MCKIREVGLPDRNVCIWFGKIRHKYGLPPLTSKYLSFACPIPASAPSLTLGDISLPHHHPGDIPSPSIFSGHLVYQGDEGLYVEVITR